MTPYNGWPCPEPDEWKGPQKWEDIVFEGEWNVTQEDAQREIGPEWEMWKNGTPTDG